MYGQLTARRSGEHRRHRSGVVDLGGVDSVDTLERSDCDPVDDGERAVPSLAAVIADVGAPELRRTSRLEHGHRPAVQVIDQNGHAAPGNPEIARASLRWQIGHDRGVERIPLEDAAVRAPTRPTNHREST